MLRLGQVCLFYLMLLWLGLMLLVGNVGLVPLVLTPKSFREPIVQRLISGLFRLFLRGAERCGLMRLDLGGLDVLNRRQNLVLVANHPSMIDVFLIVSRVHQAVCLMKASIGSNILFGVGAYLAGYVSNQQVDVMLRSATAALGHGPHLLVFPEGTRTTRQPVNDLKPGVALIAKRSGAPLQAILIRTNSPYLSKGWTLLRPPTFPLVYQATLGSQLAATGKSAATASALQRYFEQELTSSIDSSLRV
ncbi:lysophospholipid acyltransferase family protein [Rhodoferax sp.]|uniref:lysophospholipid acyltransferase family protein n=1 Tax=Rhodoferax sp. TaxID=50421 RepID=UPI00275276F7|nr:lysophospholipid acyltransferase family protein [Rhodoferax sp.]